MANERERFFQNLMRMKWLENRLGWTRETKQLIDHGINSVDLEPEQNRKSIPKIGILITLGKQLGECFKGDEWILDLVCHSSCKSANTGKSIAAANLQFEAFNRGDVRQHH